MTQRLPAATRPDAPRVTPGPLAPATARARRQRAETSGRVLPRLRRTAAVVRAEAASDGIHLVPVRAFIGLGWLRASAEKITDPGWWDGTSLSRFLDARLGDGTIALPAYESMTRGAFLPAATALGWIVILGQLLAGLAILTGTMTNAALLGGIFMNLNFVLAGVPDPSAFYIVIQAALLLTNAGAILGMDGRAGATSRHPLLAARRASAGGGPAVGRAWLAATAGLSLALALYALPHVERWDPAGSVHDPAVILAVLGAMAAAWSAIVFLRTVPSGPAAPPLPFDDFAWAAWDEAIPPRPPARPHQPPVEDADRRRLAPERDILVGAARWSDAGPSSPAPREDGGGTLRGDRPTGGDRAPRQHWDGQDQGDAAP